MLLPHIRSSNESYGNDSDKDNTSKQINDDQHTFILTVSYLMYNDDTVIMEQSARQLAWQIPRLSEYQYYGDNFNITNELVWWHTPRLEQIARKVYEGCVYVQLVSYRFEL